MFNSEGIDWDYNKIAGMFNPAECEAISKIQLPSRRTEDFVAWQAEKTRMFVVRSTYNIALLEQVRETMH